MLGTVLTVLALGALVGLIVYLFIIEPRSKYHDSHGLCFAATAFIVGLSTQHSPQRGGATRHRHRRIPRRRRTCTHALIILQARSYHGLFA